MIIRTLVVAVLAITTALVVPATAVPAQAATSPKIIYLTFDDGPHPRHTPAVLAVLRKHNVRATFFVLGTNFKRYYPTAVQIRKDNHLFANHTWNHPNLTRISNSNIRYQMDRTQRTLRNYKSKCMRPPYGATNSRVNSVVRASGLRPVLWHIDTGDWKRPSPSTISNRVVGKARHGSIVLMHDGGGDGDNTARALDIMIPKLKRAGFVFRVLPYC